MIFEKIVLWLKNDRRSCCSDSWLSIVSWKYEQGGKGGRSILPALISTRVGVEVANSHVRQGK